MERKGLVLVVDDAAENLSVVSAFLSQHGYDVRAANSGKRALSVVNNVIPDIVLLDIKMPEMDGFETCRRLKQDSRLSDMPIIFMSALTDTEATVTGFDAGAVDYVSKPFEPKELLARVNAHVGLARARRELFDANERLKELDRLKSTFIASVNHELRTPLNSIIGFTGVVLKGKSGPLTKTQEDQLGRVYASSKHLLGVVSDIIDVSKIEGRKFERSLTEFELEDAIEAAVNNIQPQLSEKGLNLDIHCPKSLAVRTDKTRLIQCLINFLSNGVKYTEKGGLVVSVKSDESTVHITITDTGIGMPASEMDLLYTAFGRLSNAVAAGFEGTGLGLYLTRKIAEEILEGTISAESQENEGSSFVLTIPRRIH